MDTNAIYNNVPPCAKGFHSVCTLPNPFYLSLRPREAASSTAPCDEEVATDGMADAIESATHDDPGEISYWRSS